MICVGIYTFSGPVAQVYIKSIFEVPMCSAQIGQKLNIDWKYSAIRDYAISSLQLGMTRDEVKLTLQKIAPIEVSHAAAGDTITIKTCSNPIGNVGLFTFYSTGGSLEKVLDAFGD